MRKPFDLFLVLLLLLSLAAAGSAYVPQFSEDKQNLKLRWKNPSIKIALSDSLTKPNPNIRTDSDIAGAVRRSLETWEKVADIEFELVATDKQTVSPNGNFGDGVSLITIAQTPENLLLFSSDSEEVSARTRVFFSKKGFITEADIVLNPYQQFSTDGSIGTFDLESTLTHEIGHLLGLDHSSVFSATMHENSGKNGVFGLPGFNSRSLAATDVSSVRALYGAKSEDHECCGAIVGKLTAGAAGKPAKNYSVWAEDYYSGKVIAEGTTNAEGSFRIEGVNVGKHRVYAQNNTEGKTSLIAEYLGEVEVESAKPANLIKKLTIAASDFDLKYIGFNGQLSDISVPVNAGNSFRIYLGGKNLDLKKQKIDFNSPSISITPGSFSFHDYGENISVFSFEIKIETDIAPGEYSVSLEDEKGSKRFIVGGVTVDSFVNPWNSSFLP